MKAVAWILSLMITGGCAAYRAPSLPKPQTPTGTGSTDWGAVVALQKGHFIFVTLDGGDVRAGYFFYATDTALTMWATGGEQTLPRGTVVRVADHVQVGTKDAPKYIGIPIASAILGGLAGLVIGAINKNADIKRASGMTLLVGLGVGLGVGQSYPTMVFEDRLVYVRP